jgi:hypothetical protein
MTIPTAAQMEMVARQTLPAAAGSRTTSNVSGRRRYRESRARRTMWTTAIAVCLSPILGGWLVDRCPLDLRFPEAAKLCQLWRTANPPPNLLYFGSSRFGACLVSDQLAHITEQTSGGESVHAFNATLPGEEPIVMEHLWRRLFATRPLLPRLVVVETNADLLQRRNPFFRRIITAVLTAADLPRYTPDIVLSHEGISRLLSSRLMPFFVHRGALRGWLEQVIEDVVGKSDERDSSKAVMQYQPNNDPTPREEHIRIALHYVETRLRHYQLAGTTSQAFERLIAELHSHGCTVLLVHPPLTSAHRALFPADMRRQFQTFIDRLCRTYGCRFVDYSARLPDEDFYDNHHTTPQGATRFTELLAHEVIAPGWSAISNPADVNKAAR